MKIEDKLMDFEVGKERRVKPTEGYTRFSEDKRDRLVNASSIVGFVTEVCFRSRWYYVAIWWSCCYAELACNVHHVWWLSCSHDKVSI